MSDLLRELGMRFGLVKPPAQPFGFPAGASLGGPVRAFGDMKMRLPDMQSQNVVDRRTSDYSALTIPAIMGQMLLHDGKMALGMMPQMPKMFADDVNRVIQSRSTELP